MFSFYFYKIFKNTFLTEHLWETAFEIFSELLLTGKFRHYLRMNDASYDWSYIDFYTLIIIQYPLITSSYIDFYNSLQYTLFILTNTSAYWQNGTKDP